MQWKWSEHHYQYIEKFWVRFLAIYAIEKATRFKTKRIIKEKYCILRKGVSTRIAYTHILHYERLSTAKQYIHVLRISSFVFHVSYECISL